MAGRPSVPGASSSAPALIPLGHHAGKPPIPLFRPVTVIGSRSNARIHLTSSSVSKAHALVVRDGPVTYIRDLSSRNHVYVNGEEKREHDLQDGDLIKIGSFTFKFKASAKASETEPSPIAPAAQMEVTDADYPVPLEGRVTLIGRRSSSDIHLLEESVSTSHAVIVEMNGQRHVRDLGSRTGTYVNGVAIHQHQLSPGDSIRVGETTLTYQPGAVQEAADEFDIDAFTVTDSAAGEIAATDSVIDEIQLGHAARHVEAQAEEDELPKSAARNEAVEPAASIDKAVEPLPLSDADEKLSATQSQSDTQSRPDADADADRLPRRGWRTGQVSPPGSDDAAPAGASAATEEAATQEDDSVLRLEPQTSADELSGETSGDLLESTEMDFSAPSGRDESSDESPIVNVDLSAHDSSAPETDALVAPSFEEQLNLSSLAADAGADRSLELAEDLTEEKPARNSEAPVMRFDQPVIAPREIAPETTGPAKGKPLFDPAAIEIPSTETPAVGSEEATEKVTASRTRKKPKQTVGEEKKPKSRSRKNAKQLEAPVDEKIEEVVEDAAVPREAAPEIIDLTEPTPESALDLADAAPTDSTDADLAATDSLTDTAVDREMNALSADAGEIVEAGEVEAKPGDASYEWGANQENFLGGYPVDLPEATETESTEPESTETAETETSAAKDEISAAPPRITRPATPSLRPAPSAPAPVEVAETASDALDDVHALIDEILAPADGSTADDQGADLLAEKSSADEDLADEAQDESADETGDEGDLLQPAADESSAPTIRPIAPLHLPPVAPSFSPIQSRPVIPIPPPPRSSRRRRTGAGALEPVGEASTSTATSTATSTGAGGHALRDDERIPPYAGALPATVGRVTTSFDGLAMPPVREADVFFQMSPPATTSTGEDPFGATAPHAPVGGSAMTPMDLVQADEPQRPRRAAIGGRTTVPRDLFFGSAVPAASAREGISSLTSSPSEVSAPPKPTVSKSGSRRRPSPIDPVPTDVVTEAPLESLTEAPPEISPELFTDEIPAPAPSLDLDVQAPPISSASRRKRTITFILATWAIVWLGTSAAIYFLMPVTSTVEGRLQFDHYDLLTLGERKQLQKEQQDMLASEDARRNARRLLTLHGNDVAPGFLDESETYLATASNVTWRDPERAMVVQYHGKEDAGNRTRVFAMMQALYEMNKPRIDAAANARRQLDDLEASIRHNDQSRVQLASDIEKLRVQAESAPDAPAVNRIKADVAKLDKEWGDAVVALKNCQAELAQLKQMAAPSTQPTTNPSDAAVPAEDAEVAQMQTQLKDLSAKMSAAQAAKNEQAAAARKALDATLSEFEKQVSSTRELMKDSPELAAYVAAAQQLQETTRSLIDDLIRRQEQQYSRLNELKTTLTEKMEQRRVELQNADPQLKELNERLETATRQLNAAKSAGMQKEIEDKKSEVDLLASMVRSRQEQLPNSPLKDYADTIAQLQQIIDVTQKNVEDDRKRTDQLLEQLQKSFTSSQSVEKLPEAQKSAASDLEKRLADINAAREQYNTAISATSVNEDESVKTMRTQIAALQTNLDARKKDLADAGQRVLSQQQEKSRQELIAQKESQLADLTKTESDARTAYTNREKDLRDAQSASSSARESKERLQGLLDQQGKLDAQIAQDKRGLEQQRAGADHAVQPLAPRDETELAVRLEPDRRPWYYLGTLIGSMVAFGGLLMFKLREPGAGVRAVATHQFDLPPIVPINGEARGEAHRNGESRNGDSDSGNGDSGNGESGNGEASNGEHHDEPGPENGDETPV